MKYTFGSIFICFLLSCSEPKTLDSGCWKVKDYTFSEKAFSFLKGARSFVYGTKLQLNSNGSYTEETCGNVTKGTWQQKDDSLILNGKVAWYKKAMLYITTVDSLYDSINGRKGNFRSAFYIDGTERLINYHYGRKYIKARNGTTILDSNEMKVVVVLKKSESGCKDYSQLPYK